MTNGFLDLRQTNCREKQTSNSNKATDPDRYQTILALTSAYDTPLQVKRGFANFVRFHWRIFANLIPFFSLFD